MSFDCFASDKVRPTDSQQNRRTVPKLSPNRVFQRWSAAFRWLRTLVRVRLFTRPPLSTRRFQQRRFKSLSFSRPKSTSRTGFLPHRCDPATVSTHCPINSVSALSRIWMRFDRMSCRETDPVESHRIGFAGRRDCAGLSRRIPKCSRIPLHQVTPLVAECVSISTSVNSKSTTPISKGFALTLE